jgi:hypothetical protein
MLMDIFNVPAEIVIDGKPYKAEYDNKGYAMLETLTGKGIYKLYNLLMVQNNLTLNESIEIVCCSLLKHHTTEEVAKVREYLAANMYAINELNSQVIWVFACPLLPPDVVKNIDDLKKKMMEIKPEAMTAETSSIG